MQDLEKWLGDQHWFIMARGHRIAEKGGTYWLFALSPTGTFWKFYGTETELSGWDCDQYVGGV